MIATIFTFSLKGHLIMGQLEVANIRTEQLMLAAEVAGYFYTRVNVEIGI